MSPAVRALVFIVPIYAVCWTISYLLLVGWHFEFFFYYLQLAWTSPGEIPAFIQILSIGLTILISYLVFRIGRSRRNSQNNTGRSARTSPIWKQRVLK